MKKKTISLSRKLEITQNILAELLNYVLLFALEIVLVKDFAGEEPVVMDFVLLGFVPLYLYLVREKCQILHIFLILQCLPLIVICVFYHGIVTQKIIIIVILVFCILVSLAKRINTTKWGMEALHPVAASGMIFLLYVVDKTQVNGECTILLLRSITCYLIGYLLYYYLKQFNHYIEVNNKTSEHIPVNKVFYSSAGMAFLFTIIIGTTTVLSTDELLMDRIYVVLENAFYRVCRFLFSLLPEMKIRRSNDEVLSTESYRRFARMLSDSGEPNIFTRILDALITILGTALTYFILTAFIIVIIKIVQRGFGKYRKQKSLNSSSQVDVVEDLRVKKERIKNTNDKSVWKRIQESFTSEEKIRRLYKKIIFEHTGVKRKDKTKKVTIKTTARETLKQFFPASPEAEELATLYEKARYSTGVCTSEDVKRAKMLVEKLK